MQKSINCYVYAHVVSSTGEPFYIGIGSTANYKRAFTPHGRNYFWRNTVNTTACHANIIFNNLTWEEACEIESTLIGHLGRKDTGKGSLVNLTDGGEGANGVIFSSERKKKISQALTGVRLSPAHIEKCKQGRQTSETISKIRLSKIGIQASDETKAKMRVTNQKGILAAVEKISKPIIDLQTGVFYNSVREAAKVIGVHHSYLSGMLLGRYHNKTKLQYA